MSNNLPCRVEWIQPAGNYPPSDRPYLGRVGFVCDGIRGVIISPSHEGQRPGHVEDLSLIVYGDGELSFANPKQRQLFREASMLAKDALRCLWRFCENNSLNANNLMTPDGFLTYGVTISSNCGSDKNISIVVEDIPNTDTDMSGSCSIGESAYNIIIMARMKELY